MKISPIPIQVGERGGRVTDFKWIARARKTSRNPDG